MWPFRKKSKPIIVMDFKAHHDHLFGDGSWEKLENDVLERTKKNNPYLYAILTELGNKGE